ncbi:hypothetical protein BB561_003620 [Smittium simulii]|uniref:Uncharacterized protein n=1 Tax=Smittium simulii TaxID=133385 RepID=A0A2T9YKC3_9FUNG|nr:hypothetical protein BB561_003620 [Smittium simulii]
MSAQKSPRERDTKNVITGIIEISVKSKSKKRETYESLQWTIRRKSIQKEKNSEIIQHKRLLFLNLNFTTRSFDGKKDNRYVSTVSYNIEAYTDRKTLQHI